MAGFRTPAKMWSGVEALNLNGVSVEDLSGKAKTKSSEASDSVAGLVEGGKGGGLLAIFGDGHLALDVVLAMSVQEPLNAGLQGGEPSVPAVLEVPAGALVAKTGVGLGDFSGDLGEYFGGDGGGGQVSVGGGGVSFFHVFVR